MFKSIYMVYDKVAQTVIGSPILEASDAPAIRAFFDALGAKDSLLAQHVADYSLSLLGTIDSEGIIRPQEGTPLTVANGEQWLAMQENAR